MQRRWTRETMGRLLERMRASQLAIEADRKTLTDAVYQDVLELEAEEIASLAELVFELEIHPQAIDWSEWSPETIGLPCRPRPSSLRALPTDSLLFEVARSLKATHPDRAEQIVDELSRRLEVLLPAEADPGIE